MYQHLAEGDGQVILIPNVKTWWDDGCSAIARKISDWLAEGTKQVRNKLTKLGESDLPESHLYLVVEDVTTPLGASVFDFLHHWRTDGRPMVLPVVPEEITHLWVANGRGDGFLWIAAEDRWVLFGEEYESPSSIGTLA